MNKLHFFSFTLGALLLLNPPLFAMQAEGPEDFDQRYERCCEKFGQYVYSGVSKSLVILNSPMLFATGSDIYCLVSERLTNLLKLRLKLTNDKKQLKKAINELVLARRNLGVFAMCSCCHGYESPLHAAVKNHDYETMALLLTHGADPNLHCRNMDWQDEFNSNIEDPNDPLFKSGFKKIYTPLHLAIIERDTQAIRILRKAGANPEIKTGLGETAYQLIENRRANTDDIKEELRQALGIDEQQKKDK